MPQSFLLLARANEFGAGKKYIFRSGVGLVKGFLLYGTDETSRISSYYDSYSGKRKILIGETSMAGFDLTDYNTLVIKGYKTVETQEAVGVGVASSQYASTPIVPYLTIQSTVEETKTIDISGKTGRFYIGGFSNFPSFAITEIYIV